MVLVALSNGRGGVLLAFVPMILAGSDTAQIFFAGPTCCPPGYSGPEGHHPVYNGLSPVNDDIAIAVKKCNDGIRGLLNTDDMIGVQIHQLLIHASY